jgi:hypothetical protein
MTRGHEQHLSTTLYLAGLFLGWWIDQTNLEAEIVRVYIPYSRTVGLYGSNDDNNWYKILQELMNKGDSLPFT